MDLTFILNTAPLHQPAIVSHQDEDFPHDESRAYPSLTGLPHHRIQSNLSVDSSSITECNLEQAEQQLALLPDMPDAPALPSEPCDIPNELQPGPDTLTYPDCDGNIVSLHGLHASIIETRSPLIAAAFEKSRFGQRLHLDTLSSQTAEPFIRFLHTGSYAIDGAWHDVPTSVLLHCKMYNLADIYDIPELQSQAYVNILRQCEFGCSSPDKPIDLCAAINFAYVNLSSHSSVADAMVQYCVTCFLSHQLGQDAEFRELAYNLRAFHQDLAKACRDRGFEDESAGAIIQLPYKPYAPETYASIEHPAIARFEDMIHHFHEPCRFEEEASPRKKVRLSELQGGKPKASESKGSQPEEHGADALSKMFGLSAMTKKTDPPKPDRVVSLPIRHHGRSAVEKQNKAHQDQKAPLWKRRTVGSSSSRNLLTEDNFPQFVRSLRASPDSAEDDVERRPLLKREKQEDEKNMPISHTWESPAQVGPTSGLAKRFEREHYLQSNKVYGGNGKEYCIETEDTTKVSLLNLKKQFVDDAKQDMLADLAEARRRQNASPERPYYAEPNEFRGFFVDETEIGTEVAQRKFEALKALDELTDALRNTKSDAPSAEKPRGKGKQRASSDESKTTMAMDQLPQPLSESGRRIKKKARSKTTETEQAMAHLPTVPTKSATPSPKASEREDFELVGFERSGDDEASSVSDDWVDVPLEAASKAPGLDAKKSTASKQPGEESVGGASSESEWELC